MSGESCVGGTVEMKVAVILSGTKDQQFPSEAN